MGSLRRSKMNEELSQVPSLICSYNAHKRKPMSVSLTKLLRRSLNQPLLGFWPTRSLNLKLPWSDMSAYITPFMCPFPITPTTCLHLFTALLLFNDHARYCKTKTETNFFHLQHPIWTDKFVITPKKWTCLGLNKWLTELTARSYLWVFWKKN